jgi:hypothetical protein
MLLLSSYNRKVFKSLLFMKSMARKIDLQEEHRKYERNMRFLRLTEKTGLPSRNFDVQIGLKKELLRAYGYNVLYAGGGEARELDECSPARLTRALYNVYENAKKQVAKFRETVRNSGEYKNLVELIEAEKEIKAGKLEGDIEDIGERVAVSMDRNPEFVLAEVSRKYGREVMGGYYIDN